MALLGRTYRWCWWWTGLSLSLLALVSWPQTWPPRGTAVRGDLPGQFDGGLERLVNNSPGGLIIIINNWVNIFLKKKNMYLGGKIQSLRTEHCHVAWQLQGLTVAAITPYSNIKLLMPPLYFDNKTASFEYSFLKHNILNKMYTKLTTSTNKIYELNTIQNCSQQNRT